MERPKGYGVYHIPIQISSLAQAATRQMSTEDQTSTALPGSGPHCCCYAIHDVNDTQPTQPFAKGYMYKYLEKTSCSTLHSHETNDNNHLHGRLFARGLAKTPRIECRKSIAIPCVPLVNQMQSRLASLDPVGSQLHA